MTTTIATADAPVVFPGPVHPLQRHDNPEHQRATRRICHGAGNAAAPTSLPAPQEPISGPEVYDETDNAAELPRASVLSVGTQFSNLYTAVDAPASLGRLVRRLCATEGIRPAERDLAAPRIRRHVSEDGSSLEVARQRRNVRALRAVVSSVHEDIGTSQTRPARVKTSQRMPDCLKCKLHGQALAVMLCEDDGGSFTFPPGPILMRDTVAGLDPDDNSAAH